MKSAVSRKGETASAEKPLRAKILPPKPEAPVVNPVWQSLATSVPVVQTKLKVGNPASAQEQEADKISALVQHDSQLEKSPVEGSSSTTLKPSTIDTIHRQSSSNYSVNTKIPTAVEKSLRSPGTGSPLPDQVRKPAERALKSDLSSVRTHSDNPARAAARQLSARAFTHQNHVYLADGESSSDLTLMAHEATHVVQQGAASAAGDGDVNKSSGAAVDDVIMRLPETPGEFRLHRDLYRRETDQVDEIFGHLNADEFDELGMLYEQSTGEEGDSNVLADFLEYELTDTFAHLGGLDSNIHGQLIENYLSDLTVLLDELLDGAELGKVLQHIGFVSDTYENLAFLHQYETEYPERIPPNSETSEWFQSRALIFLEHARSFEGDRFGSVLAAMAADIEEASSENLEGPVGTATMTVRVLFENGLSDLVFESLDKLYATVLEQLEITDSDDEGLALELFRDFWTADLWASIDEIETELQGVASETHDPEKLDEFHGALAEEIGRFLALVSSPGSARFCKSHIENVKAILERYGSSEQVAIFLSLFIGTAWPDSDEAVDTVDEFEPEEAPTEQYSEVEHDVEPSVPPSEPDSGEECEPAYLTFADIDRWIRSYRVDPSTFWAFRFNGPALLCGMASLSNLAESTVNQRLVSLHSIVVPSLQRLKRYLRRATRNALAIDQLRAMESPSDDSEMLQTELDPVDPNQPDFITFFQVSNAAYNLLDDILNDVDYQPEFFDEAVMVHMDTYFRGLNFYLSSLQRAITLSQTMRDAGTSDMLIAEYPDDHGPAVMRLFEASDTWEVWQTDYAELARAEGLDYSVTRLTGINSLAQESLDRQTAQRLQQEIGEHVPAAASAFWAELAEDENQEHRDLIYPGDVRDYVNARVEVPPTLDVLAETYLELAVRNFNLGTLERLSIEAIEAAESNDTLNLSGLLANIEKLRRYFNLDGRDENVDQMREYSQSSTDFLLFLYVMAQTQMSLAGRDGRLPGTVARTARMLGMVMRESGSTTLAETIDIISGLSGTIEAVGAVQNDVEAWSRDTDQFPLVDAFEIGFYQHTVMSDVNALVTSRYDEGGALYWLLKAEAAGGNTERGPEFAALGDRLRALDTKGGYVAARLMYAHAIGISPLVHESLKPQAVVDAETLLNRRGVSSEDGFDLTERPALTEDEVAAQQVVEEYRNTKDANLTKLDEGTHPIRNNELTDQEKDWWRRHNAVSGRGEFLPGEEGYRELRDFGKDLVFLAGTAYLGGLGAAGFRTALGGGRLATLGGIGVELGTMTGATRFRQTLATGVRPQTPFWEEFLVNAANMGTSRISALGYNSMFKVNPAVSEAARHVAGRMVAEYVTTSIVNRVHLSLSSTLHDTALSDDMIAQSYLHNAGFLVGMKGLQVLGRRATESLQTDLADSDAGTVTRLIEQLRIQDALIEQAAESISQAKNQTESNAALRTMEAAFQAKARLIERSGLKNQSETTADYAQAARLFGVDAARARMFGAVNMEPVPGTSNFTYSKGGASETAIIEQLTQSGADFRVLPGLDGSIFEILDSGGNVTTLSPRTLRQVGGTSGSSFMVFGRDAVEGTLLSGDHVALGDILSRDLQVDVEISMQLAGRSQFNLNMSGANVQTRVRAVGEFSSARQGHDPGPAQYRIETGDGKFMVVIEILNSATNDQIGRSFNHEVGEVRHVVEKIVERFDGSADMYRSQDVIDSIVQEQRTSGVLQTRGRDSAPRADDLGRIEELSYFHGKMREIRDALGARPSPAEAVHLRERLHRLEAEYRRAWREFGLSNSPEALESQLQLFEDAGIVLNESSRAAIEEARVMAEVGWESYQGLRMIDLQIMLTELRQANPNLVKGTSILDLGEYYQQRIAEHAERVFHEEMANHGDRDLAQARAVAAARERIGGTSIASWRGRAFEGLSAEELNTSPDFLAAHGHIHTLGRNNYPTYDAVSIKGATGRVRIDESPLVTPATSSSPATSRTQLQVFHQGNRIFHWIAGRPPTVVTASGYQVFLWSAKARNSYQMYQMYRATGSNRTHHDAGKLLSTPEFADRLQASIDYAETRVGNLSTDPTAAAADLTRWRTRLADLKHFQDQLEVSGGWTNARIDAYLETLRDASINIDAIIEGIYEL